MLPALAAAAGCALLGEPGGDSRSLDALLAGPSGVSVEADTAAETTTGVHGVEAGDRTSSRVVGSPRLGADLAVLAGVDGARVFTDLRSARGFDRGTEVEDGSPGGLFLLAESGAWWGDVGLGRRRRCGRVAGALRDQAPGRNPSAGSRDYSGPPRTRAAPELLTGCWTARPCEVSAGPFDSRGATPMPSNRRLECAAVLAATVVVLIVAGGTSAAAHEAAADPGEVRLLGRTEPLSVEPIALPLLQIPETEWQAVAARFQPRIPTANGSTVTTPSLCIHALRLRGVDAVFDSEQLGSGAAVLRALTDSAFGTRVFGAKLLARTRHGVRCRPEAELFEMRTHADESHPDQTLASLAELGVPLTHRVSVDGTRSELRDVLRDLIANFDLHQEQLEWTAVAVSLYLPPQRAWCDRFGERTTFDRLAAHLAGMDFTHASCAGTHVLYAMIVLARADEQVAVLTAEPRRMLRNRIAELTRRIVQNQRLDGSWDLFWHHDHTAAAQARDGGPDELRRSSQVLATGHLAECLLRLPRSLRPPLEVYRRAGEWLWPRLRDGTEDGSYLAGFCPYTHAACVVGLLRRT